MFTSELLIESIVSKLSKWELQVRPIVQSSRRFNAG